MICTEVRASSGTLLEHNRGNNGEKKQQYEAGTGVQHTMKYLLVYKRWKSVPDRVTPSSSPDLEKCKYGAQI